MLLAPRAIEPPMSEVGRSAAEAFDTWGRENLGNQKHRWLQESEWSWDQDVASSEFKRGGGVKGWLSQPAKREEEGDS